MNEMRSVPILDRRGGGQYVPSSEAQYMYRATTRAYCIMWFRFVSLSGAYFEMTLRKSELVYIFSFGIFDVVKPNFFMTSSGARTKKDRDNMSTCAGLSMSELR